MSRIKLRTSTEIRHNGIGDWYYEGDDLVISVDSKLGEVQGFLVAIHELVEVFLCVQRGIPQTEVDDFDKEHEDEPGEPGDLLDCPYGREHRFAMMIEHLIAHELGERRYGKVE